MPSYQFIIRGYDKDDALEFSMADYTSTERQIARARALLAHDPIIQRVTVEQWKDLANGQRQSAIILDETKWK